MLPNKPLWDQAGALRAPRAGPASRFAHGGPPFAKRAFLGSPHAVPQDPRPQWCSGNAGCWLLCATGIGQHGSAKPLTADGCLQVDATSSLMSGLLLHVRAASPTIVPMADDVVSPSVS